MAKRRVRHTEEELKAGLDMIVARSKEDLKKYEKVLGPLQSFDPIDMVKCRKCGGHSIIVLGAYIHGTVIQCSRCQDARVLAKDSFLLSKEKEFKEMGIVLSK